MSFWVYYGQLVFFLHCGCLLYGYRYRGMYVSTFVANNEYSFVGK